MWQLPLKHHHFPGGTFTIHLSTPNTTRYESVIFGWTSPLTIVVVLNTSWLIKIINFCIGIRCHSNLLCDDFSTKSSTSSHHAKLLPMYFITPQHAVQFLTLNTVIRILYRFCYSVYFISVYWWWCWVLKHLDWILPFTPTGQEN